jgi:twitching motility protein PilT
MAAIDTLLQTMLEKGGSDLHLTVGLPPKTRASGSLQAMGDTPLDAQTMASLLKEIVPERRWTEFLER